MDPLIAVALASMSTQFVWLYAIGTAVIAAWQPTSAWIHATSV
jgi:hypothetical protein